MKNEGILRILTTAFDFIRKHRTVIMAMSVVVVFITTYALILPALTLEKDEAAKQGGIDVSTEQAAEVQSGENSQSGEDSQPEESAQSASQGEDWNAEASAASGRSGSEARPYHLSIVTNDHGGILPKAPDNIYPIRGDYYIRVKVQEAQGTAKDGSTIWNDVGWNAVRVGNIKKEKSDFDIADFVALDQPLDGSERFLFDPAIDRIDPQADENAIALLQPTDEHWADNFDSACDPEYVDVTAPAKYDIAEGEVHGSGYQFNLQRAQDVDYYVRLRYDGVEKAEDIPAFGGTLWALVTVEKETWTSGRPDTMYGLVQITDEMKHSAGDAVCVDVPITTWRAADGTCLDAVYTGNEPSTTVQLLQLPADMKNPMPAEVAGEKYALAVGDATEGYVVSQYPETGQYPQRVVKQNLEKRHAENMYDVVVLSSDERTDGENETGNETEADESVVNTAKDAAKVGELTFRGKDYTVTAVYGADAQLPADTVLRAREITPSDEAYQDHYKEALKALQEDEQDGQKVAELRFAKFYDITFLSNWKEIEPAAPVQVTISYDKALQVSDTDNLHVVHFSEDKKDEAQAEVLDAEDVDATIRGKDNMTETVFTADSFSDYGVVYTGNQITAWTVDINLFDYDGATPATASEVALLNGKTYAIMAVISDKETGKAVGYNVAGADFRGGRNTAHCQISLGSFKTLDYDQNGKIKETYQSIAYDSSRHKIAIRLYEGNTPVDQWQYQGYSNIVNLPASATGYEFLAAPNGNVTNAANGTTTLNLKRAYDKQYNVRFNIEPAGLTVTEADRYYVLVTVNHATTGTTYGYAPLIVTPDQTVVDIPFTQWYDSNRSPIANEKFTGNEDVTVQVYTTKQREDGSKEGFDSFNSFYANQTKILVGEGSPVKLYDLHNEGVRTTENDDANRILNYYDNLTLSAPDGSISKGDIDRYLEDATDFGYYTLKYTGHSGDIEATIGADYMDTVFEADFGYSNCNVNVNRLKVLKVYTDNQGRPVSKPVTIKLKQNGAVVAEKSGTTDAATGKLELEFEGLNAGEYDIVEVIDGKEISGNGTASVSGETVYYNFSIDKAHFANNKNVNYFGTLGPGQDLGKLTTMIDKSSRVDVVILTDTEADKARLDAAKAAQTKSTKIDVALNGTEGYKHYDIKEDMKNLKQLSDELATAESSETIRVVNIKASEISQEGMAFDDDGRYIVLNIEMDQDTFCPQIYYGGQLLDCDYGQSGKSNSSHVLYNLRKNGTYYDGDVNTSKLGAGVILAPAANAHTLGGPFGGTIITDRVNRNGNELHSNNPNQIQTLNAVIQNVLGGQPTTGSLELRKKFANSSIKDRITYFTFEVELSHEDQSKVRGKSFPASGLRKGDSVAFDENGKARVQVRADNSVTITNLPEGTTYTVTEIPTAETAHFSVDHYTVNGRAGNSGNITGGQTSKSVVYNNIGKADLTVIKEVQGTSDTNKEFEFELRMENNIAEEGQQENWQPFTDPFTVSIGSETPQEVRCDGEGKYVFKLKAGQRAEFNELVMDDGRVVRYTATEKAVWNGTERKAIESGKTTYGYSNNNLTQHAQIVQKGEQVLFTNLYSGETRLKLTAKKVMVGRELQGDDFTFELREGSPEGKVIGEVKKNAADGTISFDAIDYKIDYSDANHVRDDMTGAIKKENGTREKVFTYYICEQKNGGGTGIVYAEPVEVKVKVVDDGVGGLTVRKEDGTSIAKDNEDTYTYTLPEAKNLVNTVRTEPDPDSVRVKKEWVGEKADSIQVELWHRTQGAAANTAQGAASNAAQGEGMIPVYVGIGNGQTEDGTLDGYYEAGHSLGVCLDEVIVDQYYSYYPYLEIQRWDTSNQYYKHYEKIVVGQNGEARVTIPADTEKLKVYISVNNAEHAASVNPVITDLTGGSTPQSANTTAAVEEKVTQDGITNPVTLNDANGWYYEWTGLEAGGEYFVKEITSIPGFTTTYQNNDGIKKGLITITNTSDTRTTDFEFSKIWKQNGENIDWQEPIRVTLNAYTTDPDTPALEGVTYTLSPDSHDGWTMTTDGGTKITSFRIEDLPCEDSDGNELTYYVTEESMDGFVTSYAMNDGNEMVDANKAVHRQRIVNIADTSYALPHTGGSGTTWLYLLGVILILGCGITLVARRRIRRGA